MFACNTLLHEHCTFQIAKSNGIIISCCIFWLLTCTLLFPPEFDHFIFFFDLLLVLFSVSLFPLLSISSIFNSHDTSNVTSSWPKLYLIVMSYGHLCWWLFSSVWQNVWKKQRKGRSLRVQPLKEGKAWCQGLTYLSGGVCHQEAEYKGCCAQLASSFLCSLRLPRWCRPH